MSYTASNITTASPVLATPITGVNGGGGGDYITSNTITNANTFNTFKIPPAFKMEMYKSENGGFILNIITMNPNTYQDINKLFILNDIQNILTTEILKH